MLDPQTKEPDAAAKFLCSCDQVSDSTAYGRITTPASGNQWSGMVLAKIGKKPTTKTFVAPEGFGHDTLPSSVDQLPDPDSCADIVLVWIYAGIIVHDPCKNSLASGAIGAYQVI